jgi:sugar lactone lactonase YvrE
LDRIEGYTGTQLASSTSEAPAVVLTTDPYVSFTGVAFDGQGNLWAALSGGGIGAAVVEYTRNQLAKSGKPTPKVTLTSNGAGSLGEPVGLTFDAGGNLWVVNGSSGPADHTTGANTLVEFTGSQLASSGSPAPAVTLGAKAGSLDQPEGLAFDPSGKLWVINDLSPPGSVVAFSASQLAASGNPVPAITLTDNGKGSVSGPAALAFDGGGNLWMSNFNSVVEFTGSQLTSTGSPTPTVTLGASVANCAHGLAFDAHGNLWISNGCSTGAVVEFAASHIMVSGTPAPSVTITPQGSPVALAFTP